MYKQTKDMIYKPYKSEPKCAKSTVIFFCDFNCAMMTSVYENDDFHNKHKIYGKKKYAKCGNTLLCIYQYKSSIFNSKPIYINFFIRFKQMALALY